MRRIACTIAALALVAALAAPAAAEETGGTGKSLYDKKCAMCHGADGVAKAMAKGSANFNDPAYAATADEIVKVTMEGKGKMTKFEGKLTPEQAKMIAEYVKSLASKK